ncbi:uncharacterized protein DFL_000722 [Arthrobotrys flagrans]|uniref:Uncharacterized protein n=1 Tax=Arthrobotrys flagrans TaxID=97331 RepID=A0A437AFH4_ARTFL|nr:hypothetical protein DFL_000722 [Arthrobotrys flagrans]
MADHRTTHISSTPGDASLTAENEINEDTPLLATSRDVSEATTAYEPSASADTSDGTQDGDTGEDDKPLPMAQILFLCAARLIEPIAFFSIFPYINKMCQENGSLEDTDLTAWAENLFWSSRWLA